MIITISVQEGDDPRFVEEVAGKLRKQLSMDLAPIIDVEYPSGRAIKY